MQLKSQVTVNRDYRLCVLLSVRMGPYIGLAETQKKLRES